MNRLDGFNYFMVTALLSIVGFQFVQETNSRSEIWFNMRTNKTFTITNVSGYLSEENLLEVLNQAGLSPDEFLKLT